MCAELAGFGAAFLGHRVDLVALLVAGVGNHHRLTVRQALSGLVPVLDHCLGGLGAGVVDVQAVVRLVLRERGSGFAGADLLPGFALPLVVGAMDLGQLGGGGPALDLFEQPARADRGELRSVAGEQQLAFTLGGRSARRERRSLSAMPASSITTTVPAPSRICPLSTPPSSPSVV